VKTYHGKRQAGTTDPGPVTVTENGTTEPLAVRNDLVRHSTALNWGYYGSGPAQLVFALLMDTLNDPISACSLHHAFRDEIVSALDDEWTLTDRTVGNWIRAYQLRGSPTPIIALDARP
jgi:Family of unknown function (DUF6166)